MMLEMCLGWGDVCYMNLGLSINDVGNVLGWGEVCEVVIQGMKFAWLLWFPFVGRE